MLRKQLLDGSTRGHIVSILQGRALTAGEMASGLGVTPAAVRAQITAMERDGIVRRAGQRLGTTRPFQLFELTPEVEQLLSGAYLPLLIELVGQAATHIKSKQLTELMRSTGRGLAAALPKSNVPNAPFAARLDGVSTLLNDQLGSTMTVEKANGHYILRGSGCPLAALTGNQPSVCLAVESLIATLLDADVQQCCDRAHRPQCCFEVVPAGAGTPRS